MALDANTRTTKTGSVLPLDLQPDSLLVHHGLRDAVVEFVEYTGEVALPRKGGAVVRYALRGDGVFGGMTDTAVANELDVLVKVGS